MSILSWAGAVGGFEIRWRTLPSCLGWPPPLVHSLAVYGQARSVQELDTVVGDCWVFAVFTRCLHSTVWGSNLGALLAVDPERGLFILPFLLLVVGGSLTFYALRAGRGFIHVSYGLLSREFFMLINNVILVVSLAVVLWGTFAIAWVASPTLKFQ